MILDVSALNAVSEHLAERLRLLLSQLHCPTLSNLILERNSCYECSFKRPIASKVMDSVHDGRNRSHIRHRGYDRGWHHIVYGEIGPAGANVEGFTSSSIDILFRTLGRVKGCLRDSDSPHTEDAFETVGCTV